jgi:hypothetical protein
VRAAGRRAVVALPRILKPDEQRLLMFYLRLAPDAILIRGAGALQQLLELGGAGAAVETGPRRRQGVQDAGGDEGQQQEGGGGPAAAAAEGASDAGPKAPPLRVPALEGDFSLNAANALAAGLLLDSGLSRLALTYDLDAAQLATLAKALGPARAGRLETIVHSHLPIFHTEHCVFARFLSDGAPRGWGWQGWQSCRRRRLRGMQSVAHGRLGLLAAPLPAPWPTCTPRSTKQHRSWPAAGPAHAHVPSPCSPRPLPRAPSHQKLGSPAHRLPRRPAPHHQATHSWTAATPASATACTCGITRGRTTSCWRTRAAGTQWVARRRGGLAAARLRAPRLVRGRGTWGMRDWLVLMEGSRPAPCVPPCSLRGRASSRIIARAWAAFQGRMDSRWRGSSLAAGRALPRPFAPPPGLQRRSAVGGLPPAPPSERRLWGHQDRVGGRGPRSRRRHFERLPSCRARRCAAQPAVGAAGRRARRQRAPGRRERRQPGCEGRAHGGKPAANGGDAQGSGRWRGHGRCSRYVGRCRIHCLPCAPFVRGAALVTVAWASLQVSDCRADHPRAWAAMPAPHCRYSSMMDKNIYDRHAHFSDPRSASPAEPALQQHLVKQRSISLRHHTHRHRLQRTPLQRIFIT